ncbi:hypothetical protein H1R20_g483, partial [Candolleomyces eurysporus]
MSSNEDDYNDPENPSAVVQGIKKRRIQRACDICRRKKIRCDGVQMPGNRCSNCIAYNFDCTSSFFLKKRGPPKGYVEGLENRLERLEKLLRRLCPDDKLLRELDSSLDKSGWAGNSVFTNPPPATPSCINPSDPRDIAATAIRTLNEPVNADDDNAHLILADNLRTLSIDPVDYRFFGKSSGAMLIQTAIELKNEYTGSDHDLRKAATVLGTKREEFWSPHPWERNSSRNKRANYTFPPPDLMPTLCDLYFKNVNLYLPLLHRPTFDKLVAEGTHLENDSFASTLLLVCANGSRFSEDPRVLLDGEDSLHSAGWRWFEQVQMVKKSLLAPPSLYDLQFYCLSVQFLQGSSAPQSCWTMVGIGIRLAQDVGAHRRKTRSGPLTVEDELWKRAFWVLVCMDRMVSAALGRPCAIQDEDFDIEMPMECDDEYWEHPDPEQRWRQPPGKPSLITAFNLYLKLNQVLAFSLRTIYSINKSKILLGFVGPQWEQHIVAELDSALNKWVDSVPDHLRWNPTRENEQHFNQSVVLYAAYYHIQILIHRPFIPSPSKPSPLSFPSLAICTNAARSCSHVVDVHLRREPLFPPPQVQMAVFTSGIVLLLSIWGGKRSGLSTDPHKEMDDVHKCMRALRTCERRWHSSGRLWDILYELASVGDLPLPQPSPPTHKRERDGESSASSPDVKPEGLALGQDGPRPMAGSKRVTGATQQRQLSGPLSTPVQVQDVDLVRHVQQPSPDMTAGSTPHQHSPQQQQQQQQYFSLPVYSDELGRIPLHGQIEFSSSQQPQSMNHQQYWYSGSQQPGAPGTASVNVNVNVNVSSSPTQPISMPVSAGGRPIGQEQQQHPPQGIQTPTPPSGYHGAMPDGSAGAMTPGAQQIYNHQHQLGVMAYPAGYHGGSGSSGAGPSSRRQHGPEGHYAAIGRGQPQPQYQYPPSQQPHQQPQQQPGSQQNFVDSDTMTMWSNAPTGFELHEWDSYLMNVSELTQGGQAQAQQPPPHGLRGADGGGPGGGPTRSGDTAGPPPPPYQHGSIQR